MYQTATAGKVWLHSPHRLSYLVAGGVIAADHTQDALTKRLSDHYSAVPQIGGRRMFLLDEPGPGAALLFGFDGPANASCDPAAQGMDAALILLGRYQPAPHSAHVAAQFSAWLDVHTQRLLKLAGIRISLQRLGAEIAGHAG